MNVFQPLLNYFLIFYHTSNFSSKTLFRLKVLSKNTVKWKFLYGANAVDFHLMELHDFPIVSDLKLRDWALLLERCKQVRDQHSLLGIFSRLSSCCLVHSW